MLIRDTAQASISNTNEHPDDSPGYESGPLMRWSGCFVMLEKSLRLAGIHVPGLVYQVSMG